MIFLFKNVTGHIDNFLYSKRKCSIHYPNTAYASSEITTLSLLTQDAAETYSTADAPSQWWVDLDQELEDYIAYSATVTQELEMFRMDMITCTVATNQCKADNDGEASPRVCYDVYTASALVG